MKAALFTLTFTASGSGDGVCAGAGVVRRRGWGAETEYDALRTRISSLINGRACEGGR